MEWKYQKLQQNTMMQHEEKSTKEILATIPSLPESWGAIAS